MSADFVHLHVHSHYSLLDGACTIGGLAEMAKKYEMGAVALTDHGFMGGCQEMYSKFNSEGLNPILGCEFYIAPGSRLDKTPVPRDERSNFHLVLLAENNVGYYNLCKLISEAYRNGLYRRPRIDKELLRTYKDGIIGLSACIAGEVPHQLLQERDDLARKALGEYVDIFGKENFFIELMDHGLEKEKAVHKKLVNIAKEFDLGLVCSNDIHYLKKEDAEAHEIMLCVQTNAKLSDPKHFQFNAPEYYFKSPDEMRELFGELPESLTNTVAIAERCKVEFEFAPKVNHYPVYKLEDGRVPNKEDLRKICLDNIPNRYEFDPYANELSENEQKIIERLDYELGVIENSGFCSYFLVVSDFIRHAKSQRIPVGPGRGSGAGSLVAYLSAITDIDPLRYSLLFERFLNPERVSPPDFDIDFCEKRRVEVIEYVREKYGFDSVAQICTYGQMKAKAVVKDVARVLGYDFDFGNKLSKAIPEGPKINLAKAEAESSDLKAMLENDEDVIKVFKYARVLEGLNRQLGIHAAGVIIGDQPLDNLVPLARGAKGEMVTQFTAVPCESLGLLKMDFLGLRTLTVIQNCLDIIKDVNNIDIDISKIPLDDSLTFEMLQRGDSIAVFQLESGGMQNLCKTFGVETIEHIIALLAIYRPGPMQFIPQFIRRKKGEEEIIYDHPKMEPLLNETYGIMLYQEQIMQVVQVLAGFTLGGADILRRAIGKKKVDVLAAQKAKFVEGCASFSDINEALANQIWEKIEMFAGYGFNKSHSAAYALVSYQTAYLKAHYPVEFMAAVLTSELANADEIAFLTNACKDMNIAVLPPDVNSSNINFSVDNGAIRFGLGAIKGVGEAAASKIIQSLREDGKFTSFLDFCERCGGVLNSRVIDHLARCGAFDSFSLRRSQILAIADSTMKFAAERIKDLESGQGSLFDLFEDEADKNAMMIPIPDIAEFDMDDILKSEKELLGFYVTGHPLNKYREIVKAFSSVPIRDISKRADLEKVRVCGMISSYTGKYSKNSGKPFGIMLLEDLDCSIECMLYEKALNSAIASEVPLVAGTPVMAELSLIRKDEESLRVIVDNITSLDNAVMYNSSDLHLHVFENENLDAQLKSLSQECFKLDGNVKVVVCYVDKDNSVTFVESEKRITVTYDLLNKIDNILGNNRYKLKAKPFVPKKRWKSEK